MSVRPVTLLIAALGGEGGGVLTDWIVAAASQRDLPVQSTSIPGVAQRTGATTYYIEVFPQTSRELGGRRPILALSPGVGDVDMVVASEFLEAGRAIAGGFVTPDRTLVIASTHRFHAMAEKIAMGDGRFDTAKLMGAVEKNAKAHVLFDMSAVALSARAMINSVMLGAIAASGRLPIPAEAFEAAIRAGKSADANLRGFKAGFEAARGSEVGVAGVEHGTSAPSPPLGAEARGEEGVRQGQTRSSDDRSTWTREKEKFRDAQTRGAPPSSQPSSPEEGGEGARHAAGQAPSAATAVLEAEASRFGAAADIVAEGVRRLTAYQDAAYARLYLERLARIDQADARARAPGCLTREVARHLALRMSYEDVIRVAAEKIAPERMARIVAHAGALPGEPVTVVEFLKPGIAEFCSILPAWLARPIMAVAERRGWMDRFHWGMEIRTSSVSGYLRFLLLARLRRFRPQSYRYQQEQAAIESWLACIVSAAAKSETLALEIAACARLIKGYGDTLKRGAANYALIEREVIGPVLAGAMPLNRGIDAIASARVAALSDPDGDRLAQCLAGISQLSEPFRVIEVSRVSS
jgi:indolepyruvate ferredoxin oxidoreductase, beta subunit